MLSQLFRYFFIVYSAIFAYYKILNIRTRPKYHTLITICFPILCALAVSPFSSDGISSVTLLLAFLFILFATLYTKTIPTLAITASLIAFAISYLSLSFANFVISIAAIWVCRTPSSAPVNFLLVLSGLLQYIFLFYFFRIKRLRNGMPFLKNSHFPNIGTLISVILIFIFTGLQIWKSSVLPTLYTIPFTLLLLALSLLYWWQHKTTQSYREKLKTNELEALYRELEDKQQEIAKLTSNNDYLGSVIHKDNKLIPTMELAVRSYLQNAPSMEPDKAAAYGADLLAQLQTIAQERDGIIRAQSGGHSHRPQTGMCSVDAAIQYMENRAVLQGIEYNVKFDSNLKVILINSIRETDILHLLADMIENAIIATTYAKHKKIFVHIGHFQTSLFIDVYDSGIPFPPDIFQQWGKQRHTTHADTGGSGIGLMDIWKLKEKYKASLQIYEYKPKSNDYTKRVRILFDCKNHFLVQTYRPQDITSFLTRNDIRIFPFPE